MKVQSSPDKKCQPFLFGHAVERTGEDLLPGHYDVVNDLWVVESNDGLRPIVELAQNLSELYTKTFTERERDDPGNMLALDITTKTEAQVERDDYIGAPIMTLLQLVTKTKTHNERDDS